MVAVVLLSLLVKEELMTEQETIKALAQMCGATVTDSQDAPAPNMHDGHEATCLCCKYIRVYVGQHWSGIGIPEPETSCSHGRHFSRDQWDQKSWHDVFLRARHCPDCEARDD